MKVLWWEWLTILAALIIGLLSGCAAPQVVENPDPVVQVAAPATIGEVKAALATFKTEIVSEVNTHTETVQDQATGMVKSRIDATAETIKNQNIGVGSGGGGVIMLYGLGVTAILAVLLYMLLHKVATGVKQTSDAAKDEVVGAIGRVIGDGWLDKALKFLVTLWGVRI